MRFAKGHGTGNDFVVLPDLDGELELDAALVRALCDRRTGIGADGVLRVVRSAAVPGLDARAAEWFMDYRNADGSIAEMCGNGIRVYAQWLHEHGLALPGELPLLTRDGVKVVTGGGGVFTVDMGAPTLTGISRSVTPAGTGVRTGTSYAGLEVWMGNPHVVAAVTDVAEAGKLRLAPRVSPDMDTNVEFVAQEAPDRLRMRVFERGSGETMSCGTGACAAAVATAVRAGKTAGDYVVAVPGGELAVSWTGATVLLTGPAEIVAEGELDEAWLRDRLAAARVSA